MDDDQQFCLRWNNHQSTLISVFDTLLENETLVDCTLAAEGKFLKAHKVVLSACSPYFATLLQEQYDKHPIFILKDVKYQELRAMMDYMYRGEVNISQDQLAALLKAAESLQIKGLSDNRSGGGTTAPKPEHHRATMPTGKLSAGYTLEQTKRARIAGPAEPEMGSREGSSSPSRRRRKVRRRSIENAMTEVHDNSNSSQQLQQQQTQSNASGLGAITAAASALAAAAAAAPNTQSLASNVPLSTSTSSSTAVTAPGTTLSSSKKTDIVKGTTQQHTQQQQDAMNTENVQGPASAATATGSLDTDSTDAAATTVTDKSNHKQMQQQLKQAKESIGAGASGAASASDLVIEPKAEYDDEANDEPVEDLTLDEEDMGMDDLDQNAGTSQGGEGSSQGYAPWQHDRSQDELLLATQEAQQRDPQDLTHKLSQLHKENTAPNQVKKIQKTNTRSILNNNNPKRSTSRNSLLINDAVNATPVGNAKNKRMSMSDVSDMLYEFYRANAAAKAPKSQGPQQPQVVMGSGATAAAVKYVGQTSPTSAETNEPSSIAAIATYGAASATASKNLQSDEMMCNKLAASFHPRMNYTNTNTNTQVPSTDTPNECNMTSTTAIPTSVVMPPTNLALNAEPLDIKPVIHPTTGMVITPNPSVIKPVPIANPPANPQAAAIAAALIRDGYHSFQQQMRAQELIKFHTGKINKNLKVEDTSTNKILETFLRQQRNSECDNETGSDYNDGDDEDDSRYNGFEDIHLMEGSKAQFPHLLHGIGANNSSPGTPGPGDYYSDESQKYMSLAAQAQAQAYRNLEYSLGDFGNTSPNDSANMVPTSFGPDGEPVYECRHCGKKYRWKSTLRRHENVECGGKEPSHQCPYCPYKSKQRGNLGVHVRKHHSNLPQLASKRRSKYSIKCESNPSSANVSDDSNSKLIIDCSK